MTPEDHLLSLTDGKAPRAEHELAQEPSILAGMKFLLWAQAQRHFPTIQQVRDRYGLSRATAYRWTTFLAEALGLDVADRHGGKPVHTPKPEPSE